MPANQNPTVISRTYATSTSRKRCNVYFDYNVTPRTKLNKLFTTNPYVEPNEFGEYRWYQNSPGEQFMKNVGLTPTYWIYDGTLNGAGMWSTNGVPLTLTESGNRWILPNPPTNANNYLNPAYNVAQETINFDNALKALASLFKNPIYNNSELPYAPVIIDIENSYQTFNRHPSSVAQLVDITKTWQNLFVKLRNYLGTEQIPIYAFGYNMWDVAEYWQGDKPSETLTDGQGNVYWQEFIRHESINYRFLSGYCYWNYFNTETIANPRYNFELVKRQDTLIDKYYPHWDNNKIMAISPEWQVLPSHPLIGKLVPIGYWRSLVDCLIDRGWDILVWGVDSNTPTNLIPYIEYVAKLKW